MKINIAQLQEGCVLSENVYCGTSYPLVRKKTIVTKDVIRILKAFLIEQVRAEKFLVDGTRFVPAQEEKEENIKEKNQEEARASYFLLFKKTVIDYRNEFAEWQSGSPVNVSRVRSLIYPLLEVDDIHTTEVFCGLSLEYDSFFDHCVGIALLSAYIGKALRLDAEEMKQLIMTAGLCDCGMALVPPSELASLTTIAHNNTSSHPIYSYKMLKDNCLLSDEGKMAVIQHHERLDGSGYPFGNTGLFRNIHPYAKIIAIADTFLKKSSQTRPFANNMQQFFIILDRMKRESRGKLDQKIIRKLEWMVKQSIENNYLNNVQAVRN